jgi:hypothetical protein
VGTWAWRDFAVPPVTAVLHRFGPWRTVLPQPGQFACSTLDHLVKTQNRESCKPLIHKDLFNWHGVCKALRNLATGAFP